SRFCGNMQTAPQHLGLAWSEEAMIPQCPRIALDAALARSDIGHFFRRRHVTRLAVLSFLSSRTLQPFRVSGVNRNSKDTASMTGSAIPPLAEKGRKGILAPVDVIEGAEEDLSLAFGPPHPPGALGHSPQGGGGSRPQ